MVIEWGLISSVVTPFLTSYINDRTKKLAEKQLDQAFAHLTTKDTLARANQAFVIRFGKELDSAIDLPTLEAAAYQTSLQVFLRNPSVQDILQAPLDGESPLNWKLLHSIWESFRTPEGEQLTPLPEDFDWTRVAKTYVQSVERLALTDEKLRPVIQALAAIRAAEAAREGADANKRTAAGIERIAGPARKFDLNRYARAIRESFAHLQLAPLTDDWDYYQRDRAVRLDSVYVPQSVKQALPPRDITRDYRELLKKEKRDHGIEGDEEEAQLRKQEYQQLTTRPLMEVVEDPAHQRLVILGDPGLGKSTLLKHLLRKHR